MNCFPHKSIPHPPLYLTNLLVLPHTVFYFRQCLRTAGPIVTDNKWRGGAGEGRGGGGGILERKAALDIEGAETAALQFFPFDKFQ
jgi:hypothetical protein